jgi:hypothetical protein
MGQFILLIFSALLILQRILFTSTTVEPISAALQEAPTSRPATITMHRWMSTVSKIFYSTERSQNACTSGKRGFYPPPLVPKLIGPGLKEALVPVRSAGARQAPSPGS